MTRKPKSLDPSLVPGAVRLLPTVWPIFLNGADTGMTARHRQGAVEAMSRVLVRKGHFNATVEAVDRTYQEPLDAFHFVWPPTNGAVLTKVSKAPKPKRRRR